jgi:iron complex outermembrane receptor protein
MNDQVYFGRGRLLLGASVSVLMCIAMGAPAFAQSAAGPKTTAGQPASLQEVVVTARKHAESLQRVPIAITAQTGQQLQQQNIREPADLGRIAPSLVAAVGASTPTGVLLEIRGQVTSDILLTEGQAVGLYEDSVSIPHPAGTDIAFFDLSRVEVLNGPQGTLYGRNTTGGAINVITKGADYDGQHGFLNLEGGNYNDWKVGAAVNLPIVDDKLAVRLAYQHWSREGFGRSVLTGERFGDPKDDDVARLSVKFDPDPQFSLTAKLEYDGANRTDALYQTRGFSPAGQYTTTTCAGGINLVGQAGQYCPNGNGTSLGGLTTTATELLLEGLYPSFAAAQSALSKMVANNNLFTNYSNINTRERLEAWHGVIDASWKISDAVSLRSITGVHQYTDFRTFDLLGLPGQTLFVGGGTGNGAVEPVSGVFFPPGNMVLPFGVGANDPRPLQPDGQSLSFTQEFNLSGVSFDNHLTWLGGVYYSYDRGQESQVTTEFQMSNFFKEGLIDINYDSPVIRNSAFAVFTQDDIKLNNMFSITVGARYTEETLSQTATDVLLFPGPTFVCLAGPNALAPEPSQAACGVSQNLQSEGVSYLLSFNAQLTRDILVYAKTARGFKGGALQQRAPTFTPAKPEIATDYELGVKSEWFDRRLRADIDVYDTEYANKQETEIVDINGAQSTPIVNARGARIQGVEWQFLATPFSGFTVNFTGDYIHGYFTDFPNALAAAGTALNANGLAFPAVSPWTLDVGGRYAHDLGPGEIAFQADYSWNAAPPENALSVYPGTPASVLSQWYRSIGLMNGRIDYRLPDKGLTLSVFANNLLNLHWQTNSLGFVGNGSDFGYTGQTQDPQMWGVSLRWSFGAE